VVTVSDVRSAAASGDRVATLTALRDRLASAIDECDQLRDLAPLSRQLVGIVAELDALSTSEEVTVLDELRAKRADRGADTDAPGRAAGKGA
jgi:hypothetical protein